MLQTVTGGFKGYPELQGLHKVARGYHGLQEVIGAYKG